MTCEPEPLPSRLATAIFILAGAVGIFAIGLWLISPG
mgnify:CR=1 FL=1|jgi:hypothetical protein